MSVLELIAGTVSGAPGLYLSRSIASRSGAAEGVIVVKLQFDDIETYWRDQNRLILAADSAGRIIVTSRESLRFQQLGAFADGVLDAPPPAVSDYLDNGPTLATVHPIPDGGWTVASFESLRPALATAKVSGMMMMSCSPALTR